MATLEKPNVLEFHLKILVYKEDFEGKTLWCAHCLDFDIVADGNNPREAMHNLKELVEAHVEYALENNLTNHLFNPAPPEYWNEFYRHHLLPKRKRKTGSFRSIAPEIAFRFLKKINAHQEAL